MYIFFHNKMMEVEILWHSSKNEAILHILFRKRPIQIVHPVCIARFLPPRWPNEALSTSLYNIPIYLSK